MADRITVKIKMEPYLKAFLVSVYGPEPVFFPKKDKHSDLLEILLIKPPSNFKPRHHDKNEHLEVILPYFEHLNINSYNYLTQRGQRSFGNFVQKRFNFAFEDYMLECLSRGMSRPDAIDSFIEKYNLPYEATMQEKLRKAFYRSVEIMKKYPKRKYHFRNKSKKSLSDKAPVLDIAGQ